MYKSLLLATAFVFSAFPATAQNPAPISLRQNGWTVDCSPADSSLSISAERLGIIARNIQLNQETPHGRHRLTHFSARISANSHLIIDTADPNTEWDFDAQPGKLTIMTTDFHAMLTGWADSPDGRTVSRLLDPEGLPVNFEGTDELVYSFKGARTINPSYLPSHNSEVTYLGLGHISGKGLHSLFDSATDIAVDFGKGSELSAVSGRSDAYALAIPVADNITIQLFPDYYTHTLGLPVYVRFDDSHFHSAPMVWSSWTSYYDAVTEQDVVRNADWLAQNLKPYGFQYVQLDDGYDRALQGHSWITNWDKSKFPHGPQWLTSYIRGKGLKAGVWWVPNTSAVPLKEHPDWYLYTKEGEPLLDYNTPALDSTNPDVMKFVASEFSQLDEMGFDYYKFDGELSLPAYSPKVDKSRLHSPTADFVQNYRDRMALIRDTIGPDRFIEMCPTGSPLIAVGYTNSYFNGQDLYGNWQGMHALFSSIGDNLFLNHIVSYVMPGEGLELGEPMTMEQAKLKRPAITVKTASTREAPPTGLGITLAEARTLVSYVALTGVAYPLASVMPELTADRVELLQATMPTLPIMPIDLFSRGSDSEWDTFKHVKADYYIHHYPEVLDLKIDSAAGVYDVAAETNWRSEPVERTLNFGSQLGLGDDLSYIVFDFWKQQPLGIFKGSLDLSIEPHDTRVLLIHPLLEQPQLIGNSRHISGTYSIVSQSWDATNKELNGESLTIAGKPYTLWFAIPKGYENAAAHVEEKAGKAIPSDWLQTGQFASLHLTGTGDPVDWRLEFK